MSTGTPSGASPGGRVTTAREGAVVTVLLSHPGRRNALTWTMYDQLRDAVLQVRADPSVRVLVLRGADGAFAAGTDIRSLAEVTDGPSGLAYERRVGEVLGTLLALDVPVLAVVEGPAVGAGLAIAASADVVVATPDARFGVPIARTLGNCLPAAVVGRLQRRLGVARTMTMLLTAQLLGATEAAQAGFVAAVVPADDLEDHVAGLVRRMGSGAPLTLAALKETDRRITADGSGAQDEDLLERCYGSADFREGVSAFLDHRSAHWEGR